MNKNALIGITILLLTCAVFVIADQAVHGDLWVEGTIHVPRINTTNLTVSGSLTIGTYNAENVNATNVTAHNLKAQPDSDLIVILS